MFNGSLFFIHNSVPLKDRTRVKEHVTQQGGKISSLVSAQVTHFLVNAEELERSLQAPIMAIKSAKKTNPSIHITHYLYVSRCIEQSTLLSIDQVNSEYIEQYKKEKKASSYSISSSSSSSSSDDTLQSGDTDGSAKKKEISNFNFIDMMRKKKKKVRVFISSTFLDMTQEREYLTTHLMPELSDYFRSKSNAIDFSFVDLRWGITREESRRMNTMATCLDEVESSTFFISLLGNRYGWSEGDDYDRSFNIASQSHPWLKEFHGRSISELEILKATRFANTPKNVFFYFRGGSSSSSGSNPQEPESQSSIDKLTRLKSLIKTHHLLSSTYTNVNELLKKIFDDIVKKVEYQFPSINSNNRGNNLLVTSTSQEGNITYEIEKHVSFAKSLVSNYVLSKEREAVLERLNQYVSDGGSAATTDSLISNIPPFVLKQCYDDSGNGQSSFLAYWLSQLRSKKIIDPSNTLVISIFVGVTNASKSRFEILRLTFSIIRAFYKVTTPLSEDPKLLEEEKTYWFDIATRNGRKLIWVIDGANKMDRIDGESPKESVLFLCKSLPNNIKLIVSTDEYTPIHYEGISTEPIQPPEEIQPFINKSERIEFINKYLSKYGKHLDMVYINLLANSTSCESPLYLSTVLSELVHSVNSFEHLESKIKSLIPSQTSISKWTCTELYNRIIERWEKDESYPKGMVKKILKLISVSGVGLYEHEILATLNIKNSFGFFSSSRSILTMDGNSTYIHFKSKHLSDAVNQRYFASQSNSGERLDYIRRLSSYFIQLNNPSQRIADVLPRYLVECSDWESLKQLLLQPRVFLLLSTETGRIRMIDYWNKHHINVSKQEIISGYKKMYEEYKLSQPPLEALANLTRQLGLFFDCLSYYDIAFEFLEMARDYHISLHSELHPTVCQDIQTLVQISIKQSKYDIGEKFSEKALVISKSIYGQDNFGTVDSLILRGLVQKKKANYKESKYFYETALDIMFNYFGYSKKDIENRSNSTQNYNSKIAELYNNLGDIYRKLASFVKATEYYNLTLIIYTNIKSKEHLSFAEIYKNLGLVEKKKGSYENALVHYTNALNIIKTNLGSDHVMYGLYLCDVADTKRKQDQYKVAKDTYYKALSIISDKLGQENIEIAEIYNNLGLIEKKTGNYNQAIDYYKKAIGIAEKVFSKNHPKVGFYTHNLGDTHRKLGAYEEAEKLFSKSLQIAQSNLGNDHIEVAEILNSIGLVYKKQSKYLQAEREYKRAIAIVEKSLGKDHPKIGIYSNNLADVYRKKKQYDLSRTHYTKAEAILAKSLGVNHSEYAEVQYGLGLLEMSLENYEKSKELIEKAIKITKDEFGSLHPKIGIYSNSLAEVMVEEERAKRLPKLSPTFNDRLVRSTYQSSLNLLKKDLGENHPEIADILMNMAELENMIGDLRMYKQYLEQAMTIISNSFGQDHPKYKVLQSKILSL